MHRYGCHRGVRFQVFDDQSEFLDNVNVTALGARQFLGIGACSLFGIAFCLKIQVADSRRVSVPVWTIVRIREDVHV